MRRGDYKDSVQNKAVSRLQRVDCRLVDSTKCVWSTIVDCGLQTAYYTLLGTYTVTQNKRMLPIRCLNIHKRIHSRLLTCHIPT